MPSRYQPLGNYLAGQPPERVTVTLTLDEVAALIGQRLPPSAQTSMWWANTLSRNHARVWLVAGWRVRLLVLRTNTPTVTFVRSSSDRTA